VAKAQGNECTSPDAEEEEEDDRVPQAVDRAAEVGRVNTGCNDPVKGWEIRVVANRIRSLPDIGEALGTGFTLSLLAIIALTKPSSFTLLPCDVGWTSRSPLLFMT